MTFWKFQGNIYEILVIVVTSAILTLLFDTPFQNIKKYMFQRKASKATITSNNDKGITTGKKDD